MGCKKGHTLIELVIVLVCVAILSMIFGAFIMKAVDSWLFIKSRESADDAARYSINRMTAEIRKITSPEGISIISPSEVQFTDIDGNNIDFRQISADLMRNSVTIETGLLNPNGLQFLYLDSAGNTTSVTSEIRSIRVRVSFVKGAEIVTMESSGRIRNL